MEKSTSKNENKKTNAKINLKNKNSKILKIMGSYTCGIAWYCKKCGGCCDSPTVTKKDIVNIAKYLGLSFNEVIEKYLRYFDGKMGEIKEVRGRCIFLDKRRCTIYKARPLICKLRPFSPQFKNGKLVLTYDIWFLKHCRGFFIGDMKIDKKYFKYAEILVKSLGFEEETPKEEFNRLKKRLKNAHEN
ncbi:YkgJ family cysteine cluster protein [Methanotorris igneus]|uniref:YkgJ family cysteine cluster protein n=1 Tax=Methanotorris igneus (strain DSM 5666 / JCM 11834 / Kol 5) TaxID=880724 RepID=F6BC99_METIK|nr:YkgJ family cysteine cluster protein [Methanotorris igneus]AEF97305.1 protein of unknown function UPF0153 [Methanotorris igneus Kol 5]